jgi:hypothetical protein
VQLDADAPGGGKLASVRGAYVNSRNRNVLLEVALQDPRTGPSALYLLAGGNLIPVAVPGQEMPGGGKLQNVSSSLLGNLNPTLSFPNAAGQYALSARLDSGSGAYRIDADGSLSLILKSGMMTDLGQVTGVGLASTGSFGVGLNSSGQVALPVSIDTVPMIVLLTPTAP